MIAAVFNEIFFDIYYFAKNDKGIHKMNAEIVEIATNAFSFAS